jgi:hypothetical protein
MLDNPFRSSYFGVYALCTRLARPPDVDLTVVRKDYELNKELCRALSKKFDLVLEKGPIRIWARRSLAGKPEFESALQFLESRQKARND